MNRVTALSAATALCTLWAAGCSSTPTGKVAANAPVTASDDQTVTGLDSSADVAAIAKNLPTSLDGEIRRAQQLRSKGDLDDASEALSQLMIIAPDDPRVVGEYGKVLAQKGDSQDGLAFLKRAVQLQPKDWTLYSALGVTYDQLDDHGNARTAYEHALSLKPGEASVLNNYAVSRMLAGDLTGAKRLLNEASAHGSDNPKIANNMATLSGMKPSGGNDSAATASTASMAHVASAPPKPVNRHVVTQSVPPAVVMQTVPVDPLAGPVKPSATRKLAGKAKPKHVAQKTSPAAPTAQAPALRTAADSN
jgi:Flp pilus assembly protein TadD